MILIQTKYAYKTGYIHTKHINMLHRVHEVHGCITGPINAIMHPAVLYIPAVRSYSTWGSYSTNNCPPGAS